MADIKFARTYGMDPASPFWMVWNEAGRQPTCKHPSRDAAEAEAARLARSRPGETFHVLCAMSSISTSTEIVGQRFDPTRTVHIADADVAPPAFITGEA
jgi:hypothetical protein